MVARGGGYGPGGLVYCGYTTGSNPRTVGLSSGSLFRPKLGFLVQEPILTATGYFTVIPSCPMPSCP